MRYLLAFLTVTTISATACSSPTAPTPVAPPSIVGQWSGAYRSTGCTETGAAQGSGFCAATAQGTMVLTPQQTGGAITGTLSISGFQIPISGTVDAAGTVTLAGQGPIALGAVLTVTQWRAQLSGSQLTGTASHIVSTEQPIGAASMQTTFTIVR